MADEKLWQKAEIPLYKHVIVAHGATIASLPSQIAMAVGKNSALGLRHSSPNLTTLP